MAEAVEQVEIAGFGGHFQVPQHRPGLFKKEPYQRPEDVGSSLPLQCSQGCNHGRIDGFVYLRDCHGMTSCLTAPDRPARFKSGKSGGHG